MSRERDVVRLLLEVRRDMKQLRDTLKNSGSDAAATQALEEGLKKQEADLRRKAERVLQDEFRGETYAGSVDEYSRENEPRTSHEEKKKLRSLYDPERSRSILEKQCLITPSKELKKRPTGGKYRGERRGLVSRPNPRVIPSKFRLDPQAVPPVSFEDMNCGLLDLINRGLVPKHADLTLVLADGPPAMSQESVRWGDVMDRAVSYPLSTNTDFPFDESRAVMDFGESQSSSSRQTPLLQPMKLPRQTVREVVFPETEQSQQEKEKEEEEEEFEEEKEVPQQQEQQSYTQLLDEYSLHYFLIRKGHTLSDSPEFSSFQRTYHGIWGHIVTLVNKLETILQEYNINLATVNGKALAELSDDSVGKVTTLKLLGCLVNRDDVYREMGSAGRRFHGIEGESAAATKIQSTARMFSERTKYLEEITKHRSARKIQSSYRVFKKYCETRNYISEKSSELENEWKVLQEEFLQSWSSVRTKKRLEIHIPSLSLDTEQMRTFNDVKSLQSMFLSRIMSLCDPNVEILFISPFSLDGSALEYYRNLLEATGVCNIDKRLKIMYPEDCHKYPNEMSLSSVLLCSTRMMERIRQYARSGPTAYIVPFIVGPQDISLASRLRLPLLGPDANISLLYGSKSGAKRIFGLVEVNMPIGAYDLYDRSEIIDALSSLMLLQPGIHRWVMRIDNEIMERGIGYVDVNVLDSWKALSGDFPPDEETARHWFKNELSERMDELLVCEHPEVYPSWNEYITAFERSGGVIEACPSLSVGNLTGCMFLHPDGEIDFHGVHEQIKNSEFSVFGTLYPQTSVPWMSIRDACLAIGNECLNKKIFGFVSVDFVAFPDVTNRLRVWAVDLNLFQNDCSSSCHLVHSICGGEFREGSYEVIDSSGEKSTRSIASSVMLYHPHLKLIPHSTFFALCRERGISFDIERKSGVLFRIPDTLRNGSLSICSVELTVQSAIENLCFVVDLLVGEIERVSEGLTVGEEETNVYRASSALKEHLHN